MPRPIDPFTSSPSLPARADVVIIGGGIIGIRRRSSSRKGRVRRRGGEGRHRRRAVEPQLGLVPQDGPRPARDPAGDRGAAAVAGDERDSPRRRPASASAASSICARRRRKWRSARRGWSNARPYQLDTRKLSRDEAEPCCRARRGTWQGGLYTPSDGRAEPQKAAPAIAAAARRHGAVILQQCAVRGIETQAGGLRPW